MARNEIRIEGTARLRKQLDRLEKSTRGDVLAGIVVGAGEAVRVVAGQKAPVRTGTLSKNMVIELLEKKPYRASAGVGPHKDAWYGLFQEYGTVNHAAQPFLRPAYDEQKRNVQRRMRDDLRARIRQVAK